MYEVNYIEELLGKTISGVTKCDDEIHFYLDSGEQYKMHHEQDCCESVLIEDICGDLDDLVGSPVVMAEEVVHYNESPDNLNVPDSDWFTPDSFTWTFYKIGTQKGSVTIRWFGESNGYYSESVDFEKVE